MDKRDYFQAAYELALQAKGLTSPNPAVGAVIIRDGEIAGRGATGKPGEDHAEIAALKDTGGRAQGGEMFVTLEPCVDFPGKRTPPCSRAIIQAGIRKVYVGIRDPNPQVNGLGVKELETAGIEVEFWDGLLREVRELYEDFFCYMREKRPFVIAKYAMTLDGNIATADGDSRWISNEASRAKVHEVRERVDAVMVGVGTVLRDNPRLNVRLEGKRRDPLRIVIDPEGKTPADSYVMSDNGKTVFIVSDKCPSSFADLCQVHGKGHYRFPAPFDMKQVMKFLAQELGIVSLLLEGGARLFYSCFQARVIDKVMAYVSPKLLGGTGIQPFGGDAPKLMEESLKLKDISVENIEGDIFIQGYL